MLVGTAHINVIPLYIGRAVLAEVVYNGSSPRKAAKK